MCSSPRRSTSARISSLVVIAGLPARSPVCRGGCPSARSQARMPHHGPLRLLDDLGGRLLGPAVADQGDPAGAGQLADAEGAHQLDERLDLLLLAGDLDHELFLADVDDPAAEDLDELEDL